MFASTGGYHFARFLRFLQFNRSPKIDPIKPAADRILSLLRGKFPKLESSLAHSRAQDFPFIGDWSALPHAYTFST